MVAKTIVEFTNDDGKLTDRNCGQAAAATFITYYNKGKCCELILELEHKYPPNFLGTGKNRLLTILRKYGLRTKEIRGESELRKSLDAGNIAILLIAVSDSLFGYEFCGGHWVVAYDYDNEGVYLTNQGKITWKEFKVVWRWWGSRFDGMYKRGLVKYEDGVAT